MRILKISAITLVISVIVFVFYRYYKCRKKGKESGKAYDCGLFSSEPNYILPEEVYTRKINDKCMEITDYGPTMSFRQIEMEACK